MDGQRADSLLRTIRKRLVLAAPLVLLAAFNTAAVAVPAGSSQAYEYKETRDLIALVNDAAALVHSKGEAAFANFGVAGSRWQQPEMYIFVLDPTGKMLVHPDPELQGKDQSELKDIEGRPIIRGLIDAAMVNPAKPEGWYHYQWTVPGQMLPRWKSSYVRLVTAPSGQKYIVGSGVYNDEMERRFVVDLVQKAALQVEKQGDGAYRAFRDPSGPYRVKDAYIFVLDPKANLLVNPAFPNLEGRNQMDLKDTQGKFLNREMLRVAQTRGSGWVDYMWPKPGESVPTQKSAYVRKAKLGDSWVVVGCGVYLADAPRAAKRVADMTAPELMQFVRDGAAVFEQRGEQAYPEFRQKGKWLKGDTYFFAWRMDGTRVFNAVDPSLEGTKGLDAQDVLGRPYAQMFFDAANSPAREGWVHYMYPLPGSIYPAWKSSFVKKVTFPSGDQYLVGSGVYNMQMNKAFIEDVVNRASALVAMQGPQAFAVLRDKQGPFFFMDTYVFVLAPDGTELVNPAQPSLEGKNILDLKDRTGNPVIQREIEAAMNNESAWLQAEWYKPGQNTPGRKQTFVKKVQSGPDTYIVGSGVYLED